MMVMTSFLTNSCRSSCHLINSLSCLDIRATLITTDGTTLLGADNKAGIAEIMTAMDYLIKHPEIKHGTIRVAFTPDEEIGRGPHKFDVKRFNASFAYTVDGGPLGELEYESFNAAAAKITIKGNNVHPGTAKGKMINSAKIAMKLNSLLPADEAPEYAEGYEGFYHLLSIQGDVEETKLHYIIRDFDKENFQSRKETMKRAVEELQNEYGQDRILLDMNDQYYNMREKFYLSSKSSTLPSKRWKTSASNRRFPYPRRHRRIAAVLHGTPDAKYLYRRGKLPRQI